MNFLVERIASLIIKQWRGELTIEETIELEQWAGENRHNRDLLQQLTHDETLRQELITYYEAENAKEAVWRKIEGATNEETTPIIPFRVQHTKKYRYLAAAVTTAAIVTTIVYFWLQNKPRPTAATPIAQTTINDILPGGNKAILKLSDGKTIILDNAHNGLLAEQGAVQIEKQDGQVSYSSSSTTTVSYNSLATPPGGQFQIKLPDGTRVWLNASSSITYPTAFVGKERRVTITGEGYFEVAPVRLPSGQKMPFKVTIQSTTGEKRPAEVEVLGTHFNINAYDDEAAVKTTLLEGKVKIVKDQSAAILKPGQQAQINDQGKLQVKDDASMEEVVAWKNGEFLFQSADISTLMRQVARWYDIEISYPDGKPTDKFSGKIGRNVNLSQLLKILEYSEVRFELKGRTLVVKN